MMKTASLVSLAVFAMALEAQTPASPQAQVPTAMNQGSAQTRAAQESVQATSVSAEFTKSVDTKRAKVGDEINVKTTGQAKLPDGTELPKGTKLVGNVVDVKAKSKEEKDSHLVLALNRAVLKDGKEVPIRAAVTSMTAPASSSGSADMSAGSSMGAPSAGGGAAGAGGSSGSSGGASAAPSAPTMSQSSMDSSTQPTQGQMLKSAQDRVAVGNMPKVMLSAPTTPDSAGVLDAAGQNISLDSGTKLTLNVIPAQPGTQAP